MRIQYLFALGSIILIILAFGFITNVCADVSDTISDAQSLLSYEPFFETKSILTSTPTSIPSPTLTPTTISTSTQILVVERDAIRSTALWSPNEALVVNHEIFLLNDLNQSITVNFSSFVLKDKYKRCKFYPAFGSNAMLNFPLFLPSFMKSRVKNVTWLDNIPYGAPPEVNISETDEGVMYHYDNVTINPGVAVIAVYENYYDTVESLYSAYGLNTTNLAVFESYGVFQADNQTIFNLNYELENTGNNTIVGIKFGTFFPFRDISEKTLSSPNVTCIELTMQDGNGEWAEGYLCLLDLHALASKCHYQYSLNFSTSTLLPQSSIRPLLILTYPTSGVEGEDERIWPPWELNIENEVNRTRYYTMVSLVVPDMCSLSVDGITQMIVPIPTSTAILLPAQAPTPIPTQTPLTSTPGFELTVGIIGLLAVAYLIKKSRILK